MSFILSTYLILVASTGAGAGSGTSAPLFVLTFVLLLSLWKNLNASRTRLWSWARSTPVPMSAAEEAEVELGKLLPIVPPEWLKGKQLPEVGNVATKRSKTIMEESVTNKQIEWLGWAPTTFHIFKPFFRSPEEFLLVLDTILVYMSKISIF